MRRSGAPLDDLVHLERYPIDRPRTAVARALVGRCRAELAASGCFCLEGFLRAETVERLASEAAALAPAVYHTRTRHNPYFSVDDTRFPEDHPRRWFMDRSNGLLAYDQIPQDSDLRRLYDWPALMNFLAACLSLPVLHRYADPLAAATVNIMDPGDAFPWHFDTNDFTTSLVLQNAEEGGHFEFAPGIRNAEEENYAAVGEVLGGAREKLVRLDLAPGDLQCFKGRHSLHRVTATGGRRPRYVLLLSYTQRSGVINFPHRAKEVFGRALPAHYAAEATGSATAGVIED